MSFYLNVRTFALCIFISLLIGCSPKATLKSSSYKREAWDEKLGYAIIPLKESPTINGVFLGELYVGDSGLSIKCDYNTMIDILKAEAFKAGANLIKLKKVKQPDFVSSCYRFTADLYYSLEYKNYEKNIFWTEARQLAKTDFKANSENRPYDSRSQHKILYTWHRTERSSYWYLKFKASFNCEKSYINEAKANEKTMLKELLLFDISEKYARLMVEEMKNKGVRNLKSFNKEADNIMKKISDEWDLERDRYLFELQEDPKAYDRWRTKISDELKSMDLLAKKRLLIEI